MVKRHAKKIGLSPETCNHTFRATRITEYMKNGGTIEKAAKIANHESTRTTGLYNRQHDDISLDEIERILI
jgi:integrase